ncbi:MAG: Magnesium transport protein CorA [Deltaproteobacteria bacterium ADurb.Bin510]|nr:MAG: Magnesium transport protein CorA [Deltaproteobacteria bacterium ADurb.Bin510]
MRWINIQGLHDTALIETVGRNFSLHPLLLEDITNTGQRPKLEDYNEQIFIVLKALASGAEAAEQLSLVLGANYVISFEEGPPECFKSVRERLVRPASRQRQLGSDYLCYSLMDTVIDDYFSYIQHLEDRLVELEERLLQNPDRLSLNQLYHLRSEQLFARRLIVPLRDVIAAMRHGQTSLIKPESAVYLRDLADHVTRIDENLEMLRTLTSTMLETYLSSQSMRTGEIMRILTLFSTIFIPLTFVVGLYGMNFDYMPELHWRAAYPLLLIGMALIVVAMLAFFRRKHWLWPPGSDS